MKYKVKKKNKVFEVLEISPLKGYKFTPKNKDIKNITLINDKLINKVLTIKIESMFKRLLMIVNDAFNSDDNPDGTAIALDEILMVKNNIKNKYAKFLKEEKELLYLKKLGLLEEEMMMKMYSYQNMVSQRQGKSR